MEKNKKPVPDNPLQINKTHFEETCWNAGAYLCGIDEVGRGSLLGPVVTAAVILKPYVNHELLIDSKILPEKKRNYAATWIFENSWYAFGMADHTEIDTIGIYQATQHAMLRAIYGLLSQPNTPKPSKIVIDAMPLVLANNLNDAPSIESFCYGESKSISIAAASIIAKIKRDSLLHRLDTVYTGYGLSEHKGYGTKIHTDALLSLGPTLIHRATFIKNLIKGTDNGHDKKDQVSLFC
jgi:ribonuclease HII